jgi:hypothetical protein
VISFLRILSRNTATGLVFHSPRPGSRA